MSYGNYPDLKDVKKILVIKMRHLGDVLLSSPVFSILRQRFPSAHIDALIYSDTYQMLEGSSAIDGFLLHNRKKSSLFKKIVCDLKLYYTIRKNRYDLVINLTEGDRGAIAAIVSKASIRVGFEAVLKGLFGKKKAFTHLVRKAFSPKHTVEKDLDALRKIGIFPSLDERKLDFTVPQNALIKVKQELDRRQIPEKSLILIHSFSRWKFKCWKEESLVALIKELQKEHPIALTGSDDPTEVAMAETIISKLPNKNIHNFVGQFSLKELGALMQLSRALVSVDTVAAHMACSLKLPLVVLFGPTSELIWGPWMHPKAEVVSQKRSCQPCHLDGCGGSKLSDCLFTLEVSSVLSALYRVIS